MKPAIARQFTHDLRASFLAKHTTAVALAPSLGVSPRTLSFWLRGTTPMAHQAEVIGEVFTPHLAELLIRCWTTTCRVCGGTSVKSGKGGTAASYCGPRCKATASFRRRKSVRQGSAALERSRLRTHQEAVAAHCHDCTLGVGLCPLWTCHLRPVSPLPLSPDARRAMAGAA